MDLGMRCESGVIGLDYRSNVQKHRRENMAKQLLRYELRSADELEAYKLLRGKRNRTVSWLVSKPKGIQCPGTIHEMSSAPQVTPQLSEERARLRDELRRADKKLKLREDLQRAEQKAKAHCAKLGSKTK